MPFAVILAAGRGTRLKSVTEDLPKPLLPLAGRPMLDHVIERLGAAGFDRFLLVVGYRHELFRERYGGDERIRIVLQEPVDGTGSAALLAREAAGGNPFLLIFGDILADPADLRGLWRTLSDHPGASAVLAVKWVEDPYQGAAVYEGDGRVTRIVEKPPQGTSTTHWNSAGTYAFRPKVFDYLSRLERSPRGEYELTAAISQMVDAGEEVRMHAFTGDWLDVGRPEDVMGARRLAGEEG
jgi:NDP-sugar pyrophosphorylase family protein